MRTDRRLASSVTVATVAALALAACNASGTGSTTTTTGTSDAVRGGTLNVLGVNDVDYMDPNITYYSTGYLNVRLWSRQLFSYPALKDQTTTPAADLATELPTQANGGVSADGRTYTITLRSGVAWNTTPARPVTAADAVRGVKRSCNPVQPFGGLPDFESLIVGLQAFCDGFAKVPPNAAAITAYLKSAKLSGVVAKDDQTVVFHLTRPASYFVGVLTLSAFSPAPAEYDAYVPASAELAQHTVSDGPYAVSSYVPTKSITYTRNPAWRADTDPIRKAWVNKIVVNETGTQDSIQQQLETGTATADMEFDVAPPPSQLPGLIAKKDPNFNLGPTSASNPYLVFNTVSPSNDKAMQDVKVRRAVSMAVNRANILQVLGGPKVNPPLTHVLPPEVKGSQSFDLYPYDPTKAKGALAAAGHAGGLTLKVLYRSASQGSSKTFQTLQQDLSKVGITVVGVPSPNADFFTKYAQVPSVAKRGVWDIAIAGWGPDWYGDTALSFFGPLFSGPASFPPVGSNFGFYSSPTTTALVDRASGAATADDAAALWAQADRQVMQDAAIYPITSPLNANYHATQVKNAVYIPTLQNFDPANVWLAKNVQGG